MFRLFPFLLAHNSPFFGESEVTIDIILHNLLCTLTQVYVRPERYSIFVSIFLLFGPHFSIPIPTKINNNKNVKDYLCSVQYFIIMLIIFIQIFFFCLLVGTHVCGGITTGKKWEFTVFLYSSFFLCQHQHTLSVPNRWLRHMVVRFLIFLPSLFFTIQVLN